VILEDRKRGRSGQSNKAKIRLCEGERVEMELPAQRFEGQEWLGAGGKCVHFLRKKNLGGRDRGPFH